MYRIVHTKRYRKDFKKLLRSGVFDASFLNDVINLLARGESLPQKLKDHSLKGSMKGHRECHIKPDLLLVYKIHKGKLILELIRLGSHSELFGI